MPQRAGVISVTPQARPAHPGAPRPTPEAPGAPRPTPDTHPGAPRPGPDAQPKPTDLPLGHPPSGPPPVRHVPSPMQPPMQPTMQPQSAPPAQPPMQPQSAPPAQPPMQPPMQAPMQPPMQAPMQAPMQPTMQPTMAAPMQAPMQHQSAPPAQPPMQAPMQPTMQPQSAPLAQPPMQAPLLPQMAAPMLPTQAGAGLGATGTVAPQGLSSPKPPPRSRSSHVLPPETTTTENAPATQINGVNGIQREAQWKPGSFDTLSSDLSASWLNTQSLTRNSSLRSAPTLPTSSFTLPSSLSLHSTPLSTMQGFDDSSTLPPSLTQSLLPPPPVPSRSRSQEALQRGSPNPFLSDPVPARPNSTNPFTGPLVQQCQRRSLTPDFLAQQKASRPGLDRTMSAFTQPLAPTPASLLAPTPAPFPAFAPTPTPGAPAPPPSLHRTMPLLGPSMTPLIPAPGLPLLTAPSLPAPMLPLSPPSSLPAPLSSRPQPPPPPRPQLWVTFDDDSLLAVPAKAPPVAPTASICPPSLTQTQFSCSGFDSDPHWATGSTTLTSTFLSRPPPIPARMVPGSSQPALPARATDNLPYPKDFTER
ncbi:basic proline-rich protein-like isoform X1 [Salvelinus alpinus]|uniref:basic proline-rich protein-like isoform X1 n=1 Tax=Salvelinus alpinus TaxID=8036 RepID=UPI0039FD643A